jgi:hypothetical protein
MPTATKIWHCECCNEEIKPGEKFEIKDGSFLKEGHPKKKCVILLKKRVL